MPQFLDRVRETSTAEGTGDFILDGAYPGAYIGFDNFSTADFYYAIVSTTEDEWEVGVGTYELVGSDRTLHRDTVLSSSNSNSLVNFTAGTKDVFNTIPASVIQCILEAAACGPGGVGGGIDPLECSDVTGSGCLDYAYGDSVVATADFSPQRGNNAFTGTLTDVLDATTNNVYATTAAIYNAGSTTPNTASPRALRITWSTGSGGALENLPAGKTITGIKFRIKHWMDGAAALRVYITDGRTTNYQIPEDASGVSPNIPVSTLHCSYEVGSDYDWAWFTTATDYYTGSGIFNTDDILAAGGLVAQVYSYLVSTAVTTAHHIQSVEMRLCWSD